MPSSSAALLLLLGLGRVLGDDLATSDDAATVGAATVLVVTDPNQVFAAAPPTIVPKRPRWIRHRVRPRDRTTQIAARYGVTHEDLLEWNHLGQDVVYPERRRTLRVQARRIPPPRRKIRYVVREGEGWMDVAAKFRVERKDLRAYNWRVRPIRPGVELTLWVDPGLPYRIRRGGGLSIPTTFDVPEGGLSVGRPQRGRLENGVQLPKSDLYARGYPGGLWGSTHTISQLMKAFAAFRHDTGFDGEVVVGAISRKRGRRFPPHLSHRSGRDVDIRLPRLEGVPRTNAPNPDEIDWYASWGLIQALVATGQVSVIFLDIDLQSRLYEAARTMGGIPETLAPIISWPNAGSGDGRPVVRHADGHDGHIHVRFRCGPDEQRCKGA
jgi:hypothetical protein